MFANIYMYNESTEKNIKFKEMIPWEGREKAVGERCRALSWDFENKPNKAKSTYKHIFS